MRTVGSAHADPYSATAAASAALYGPRHGGANEAVLKMLTEIGSYENVPAFIDQVKAGRAPQGSAIGSTRTTTLRQDHQEDRRRRLRGHGQEPALDIALKLEEVALADDYFVSRKLYPNVDFYSGLIYQAMGFPIDMFTVLFAIPRVSGWLAHWKELLGQDARIAQPRQTYIGAPTRLRGRRRPLALELSDRSLVLPASGAGGTSAGRVSACRSALHVDQHLADAGVLRQVRVRSGDLRQRETPVDHRCEFAALEPGSTSVEPTAHRDLLFDRPVAQRRADDLEPLHEHHAEVDLSRPTAHHADLHDATLGGRSAHVARQVRASDHVEHHVHTAPRRCPLRDGDEVLGRVVDHHVGAEAAAPFDLRRRGGHDARRADGADQLDRRRADPRRSPCTSAHLPAVRPPCSTNASKAVMNTSGIAAASARGTPRHWEQQPLVCHEL
jgi:hypothetical protein